MFLSQVRRNGALGLVGYLVFAAGYLSIMGTPSSPPSSADHRRHSTRLRQGRHRRWPRAAARHRRHRHAAGYGVEGPGLPYLVGGLLFGIALFRARVLARWATVLLAVSGLVSAALSLMPDAFYRLLAYPNGIAMIGLGVSLWFSQRERSSVEANPSPAPSRPSSSRPARRPPPSPRSDEHSFAEAGQLPAELAGTGRSHCARHNPGDRRRPSPGPTVRRSGDDAGEPAVRRVALAGRGPHRQRRRVRARGRLPVRASPPAAPTGLAPQGRTRRRGRRAGGGALGAVAEPVLPAGARHPRRRVPAPAHVRRRAGGHPRPRVRRRPPPPIREAPGVDDPQLRDRPGGGHTGLHAGLRRRGLRHRGSRPGADAGRGVGDQPDGRGVGDPSPRTSSPSCSGPRREPAGALS